MLVRKSDLNNMIVEYNKIISDRNIYRNQAGSNNFLVKTLEPQLDNMFQNISLSLSNFSNSIDLKLANSSLKRRSLIRNTLGSLLMRKH